MTATLPHIRPPAPASASGSRLRAAARRHGPVLAMFGTLKLAGFCSFLYLLSSTGDYRTKHPRFGGGAHAWDVLATWDGWWYQQIAQHGYDPKLVPVPGATGLITLEGNSAAFFPLYPALIRLTSTVTGLGSYGAGLLVSIVASFAAALGIYAVAERFGGRRSRARGGRAVGGVAGLGRGVGGLLRLPVRRPGRLVLPRRPHPPLAHRRGAHLRGRPQPAHGRRADRRARRGRAALPAPPRGRRAAPAARHGPGPAGLLGYLLWVGNEMGDLSGYFKLQSGAWAHSFDYGEQTWDVLTSVPVGKFDYLFAYPFADVISVGVILLACALLPLLLRLRPPAVLVLYTVLTLALVLGSQQIVANISRYLLPCFPLFLPLAVAMRRLSLPVQCTLLGIAALASGSYAGYALFELGVP